MKRTLGGFLTLFLPVVFAGGAWAHALWLEPLPEGRLALRFGEYDNKLREPSEKLRRLGSILGQSQETNSLQEIPLSPLADGFSLARIKPEASALFRAVKIPVRDPKEGQAPSRSLWFGRWIQSWKPQKPALPLDIVPVSNQILQIFSKDSPLPQTTVKFLSSGGEKGELLSNEKGLLDLKGLKPGFYILTAQTQEKQAGTLDGKTYESLSTRMTLSFNLP